MRRDTAPFGLAGGGNGAPGRNFVLRKGEHVELLGGRAEVELAAGDEIVVATPGGGGFGLP
jgi:5-oxoprolinase (ATP-hydrolysing)